MENHVTSAQRFEPNSELKNWWLNTRKKKRKYGSVELPGLFRTYSYSGDAIAFLLIMVLELWGLYNFWLLIDQIIYTIALFFADALLAIASHIWTKKTCLAKNRLALAKYGIIYMIEKNPSEEIEIEKNKLKNYRIFSGSFQLLIILLAFFKIFSFLGNYAGTEEGVLNGLSITIILSYLLVAVLHIRSTGYFLSEVIRKYRAKSQYNTHLHSEDLSDFTVTDRREFNVDTYRKENFEKLQELTEQLNYVRKHEGELRLENVGTRRHHVLENNVIKSYGVLNDDDLQNLIEGQKNVRQKECLAIFGLMHQLEILDAAVYRPKGGRRETINPDIPLAESESNDTSI